MDRLISISNHELIYSGFNLKDIAIKYGTPLKITFLDLIKERVLTLKESFDCAIKELSYPSKFIYLNANKANYGVREIIEAFKYSDGLETSSHFDLLLTLNIFKRFSEFNYKQIVCNGFKERPYVDEIIKASNEGYNITDIIDSISEYEYLKKKNTKLKIGLRVHLSSKYIEEGDTIKNDRFGLMKEEFDYILEDIKNTSLVPTTIHFHQRGFDYEEEKFKINFEKTFNDYYVKANKLYSTIVNFNMGGGTPLPLTNDFDYKKWAKEVIGLLNDLSNKHQITKPNLLSENGKYSVKDSTVNIYKVVGIKHTDPYEWNIIDGSLLIALPEMYALDEPITISAINGLGLSSKKAYLGGITCDCDDVYYEKDKGYIELPDIKEDLYIGLLGTGSYQNSMNGKGGIHHCLLPEEKDLLIYSQGNKLIEEVRSPLQTIEDILSKSKF